MEQNPKRVAGGVVKTFFGGTGSVTNQSADNIKCKKGKMRTRAVGHEIFHTPLVVHGRNEGM